MDHIHEKGLERLHILLCVHFKLALSLHLCDCPGGLLQLGQRPRQIPLQLDLLLQ